VEDKIIEKVDEKIKEIVDDEITPNNLDYLYKLSKIKHVTKEGKNTMRYNEYGNYRDYNGRGNYGRGGYGNYNEYGNYGDGSYGEYNDGYNARGRDSKYRGYGHLDRMYGEYGRYSENRERYGAGQETDKSFHYMIESLEDFIKVLQEEAQTPQQKQMLNEALQRSMR
jgi:hypothetical protein